MNETELNEIVLAKKKYEVARRNLLLMLILSAVNMLLLILDTSISFCFSLSLPQLLTAFGVTLDLPFFYVLAVIIICSYLLCFFFSKKGRGWMIVAFIFFMFDWLFMIIADLALYEFNILSILLDLAFHVWITIYLASGMKNGRRYSKLLEMREQNECIAQDANTQSEPIVIENNETPDAPQAEEEASDEEEYNPTERF